MGDNRKSKSRLTAGADESRIAELPRQLSTTIRCVPIPSASPRSPDRFVTGAESAIKSISRLSSRRLREHHFDAR